MSDTADFMGREEVEAMVLAKVVEDPAFAARLKADPKAALSEMFQTKLPANLNIHVFQETPTDLMIRLPIASSDELSETELEGVAGGACSPLYIKGILGLIQVGAVIAGASKPRGRGW
jgi:hypothetical protein